MKYTPEHEVEMKTMYEGAESDSARKNVVTTLAEKYETSKNSVVAKLSSMGIYIKPSPTTKTGDPIVSKQEYVNAIRIMLSVRDNELETFEKASKRDLKILMDKLIGMSEEVNLRVEEAVRKAK